MTVLLVVGLFFSTSLTHAQTVADPSISPASGTVVPVSVSMTCTTPAAVIRYTLDGTVPTVTSPVFTTNLPIASLTLVRAKAFKEGDTDSGTTYAYYVEPVTRNDVGYYRSVTNTAGNLLPLISVSITNSGVNPVACFTIEEKLPGPVTPVSIDSGGQWLPTLGVIRWGPYTNVPVATVSYRLTGMSGDYSVSGLSWADGRWQFVPPDSTATILDNTDQSVPVPPAQVATPVITPLAMQAESATLGGGVVNATTNAGYNGTEFASFPLTGGSLQYSDVNGGMGGAATLTIRYALGTSARSGRLIINGITNTITFNTTTTWTNWTVQTSRITLNAGAVNTIRLESSGSGLANVDEITVAPDNAAAPVSVVITDATAGAAIYYTLDGTLPTAASSLYTGVIALSDAAVVRARAFVGTQGSVAAVAYFAAPPTIGTAVSSRSINTNTAWAPVMTNIFTPGTGAVCQAYEETVPTELTIANVSGDGVWSNGVVRWGPYLNNPNPQTFTYQATGKAGSYTVSSRWSRDGAGADMGSTNLMVADSGAGGIVIPVAPSKLPAPVLTPALSATLPANVTITNAVAGVEIRYTTDGTTPTTNSALYATTLNLTSSTTLRVRAFLTGWLPSDAVVGYYGALTNDAGSSVALVRTIPVNTNAAPQITLTATPQGSVRCYTITETVPLGLVPTNITQNAVWNATNRTLKWGPFTNETVAMNYQLAGMAGTYVYDGQGSVDGYPWAVTGQSNLVVTASSGDVSVPVAPMKLPTPVLSPISSTVLPTNVTATCANGAAQLRYTLDGTVPTASSPLYSGALPFSSLTTLRVRAFLDGYTPSDAVVGYYQPAATTTGLTVTRVITNSPGYAPAVKLTATPIGNVSSYTVVESVPYGLTPFNVSPAGSWNVESQTLKWGPFTNSPQVLTYQVCGTPGTNLLAGAGSVDGFAVVVTGNTNVVVDLSLMPNPASPAITLQPLSQPVAGGYDLVLYVQAVGAPDPAFYWRKDGVPIDGANSPVFTRANFQPGDVGAYDVIVSNSVGNVTSQPALITLLTAPSITNQPQSLVVRVGQAAVFTVGASAVPAPTYQWRFNGTPLNGQTSPTLTLLNVTTSQSGNYDVVVANQVSTVPSAIASLLVQGPLTITNGTQLMNGQMQFQVSAISGHQYRLQYKNDLAVPGWTDLPQVPGTNGPLILTDTPGAVPQRFYRVQEQ